MKEFAFDIKLAAVVRVEAETVVKAREMLKFVLDCLDLSETTIDGLNDGDLKGQCELTEASLWQDDEDGPRLFEVDGEAVD